MTDGAPFLQTEQLTVHFPGRRQLVRRLPPVQAVSAVDLSIDRGTTLGLVGESGSGKSTLGRALVGLTPITSGRALIDGVDLAALGRRELREQRRRIHLIFQDPYSSLNPSMVVRDIVAEPLEIAGERDRSAVHEQVMQALERVGLGEPHLDRYPQEFSGGQRQRIAIARALVSDADVIVCDEAVSALDVSTQGQVVNLLEELQRELGLTYLFIAHDLSVVRHISDRIAVMYLGEVVEEGPAERVYLSPSHPYTASLLASIPRAHPDDVRPSGPTLDGDVPSATSPPSGCRFRTRCAFAMERCAVDSPTAVPVPGGGHVRCHLYDGTTAVDVRSLPEQTATGGAPARPQAIRSHS